MWDRREASQNTLVSGRRMQGVDTSLLLETDSGASTASCLCLVSGCGN